MAGVYVTPYTLVIFILHILKYICSLLNACQQTVRNRGKYQRQIVFIHSPTDKMSNTTITK